MELPKHPFFEIDVLDDKEIDSLFMQLEVLEPPDDFVQQMLLTFSRLPIPQILQEESDGLTIHHEPKSSS